jgi:5'-nucleotidase
LAQGGGVANLVAQSFLASFPNADLVISNAGLSRGDVAHGNFTGNDADVLLPFNNVLFLLQMKGSELHFVMEEALDTMFSNPLYPLTGAYPYAAALKYAVNMTADFGNRLSDLQVKDRETGTWGMLDLSFVYTVVANSFIVEGGDGYLLFGQIKESEETTVGTMDAFLKYAWAQSVLLDPPLDDYSTISYIPPVGY